MSEWRDPLPEPETDLIEPPIDTDFEPDLDDPEDLEDEEGIIEDEDDDLDEEDIPLVDATENRR
jgi:hypothetical protein